ncbi:MAG: AMP-binding protein [Gammaproteobacteria bacterium]|nr:AMP-binding protein [Gammaproteobacteria bacterium]
MEGLMQEAALLTSATLTHAAENYPETQIATAQDGAVVHRTSYLEADARARRLASSLSSLELAGEDVFFGALGFNSWRLFEVMHAVPGSGRILHTANPRLHETHLSYTVRHANDQAVFVDLDCLALAQTIQPLCPDVKHWILLCDPQEMPTKTTLPKPLCYEELIANGDPSYAWPALDERNASTLCFTSATTGDPKGVLYSHRGTVLNILTIAGRNGWNLGRGDCVLSAAPFFHCNGWGMPYMAPMVGAKLVLPGRNVSARATLALIRGENVTHSGGVPTVLTDLVGEVEADGGGFANLRHLWTGATAPPEQLLRRLEALGPKVTHAFGMTETTQALTVSVPDPNASATAQRAEQLTQGQPVFLSGVRAVNDAGEVLAKDGQSIGHLQVRGPSVATCYYRRPDMTPVTPDGWLETGDIGTVGAAGQLRITDRAKDAIKSGGEWISSVLIENIATDCPGVSEAACVGVEHPRWQERPVLLVVPQPGIELDETAIRAHLEGNIATWWMPDAIRFVEALPKNSVGKVLKAQLRDQHRGILVDALRQADDHSCDH